MKFADALAAALIAVYLMAGTSAGAQSAHTAALVEGAKKEGKLVWYTAMNVRDGEKVTASLLISWSRESIRWESRTPMESNG